MAIGTASTLSSGAGQNMNTGIMPFVPGSGFGQNMISQAAQAVQAIKDTKAPNEGSGGLLGEIEKLEQLINSRGGKGGFLGTALQRSLDTKIEEYNNNALRTGGRKYGEAVDDENYLARVAKRRASFEAMNSAETEPTSTLGVVPAQFQGETLEENNTNMSLQSPGVDTMSAANNTVIGGVPVSTVGGGFSPNTTNTSKGIYGNAFDRQRAFKKPLIKLT
tara:strand:+ start:3926 stop:4585 length:660 start_codon:yes stop_codon:yes gene_type:complete